MPSSMFGMTIDTAKRGFFDRESVIRDMDRKTRRVFSRFGAFVRRAAKSSIRKRKRSSEPGKPPSSHTGLLKRFIFFAWDAVVRSVVIGPTLINTPSGAPETLEYGGKATIFGLSRERDADGKRKPEKRVVDIKPRPFMNPAFEAEQKELPAMWRRAA